MSVFVDLYSQVQRVLRRINGGTDNDRGWSEGVVQRYQNNDQGVIPLGALVKLRSGGISDFVELTTTEEGDDLIGVVVGTYESFGPRAGQFQASAPSNSQPVAVMTAGTTFALATGTITRGQYAYTSATPGYGKSLSIKRRGAFGRWLATGSNGALVRLPLTSIFTGSEIIKQYGVERVTDLVTLDFSSGFAVHSNSGSDLAAVDLAYENFELNANQIKVANASNYFIGTVSGTEVLRPTSDIVSSAASSIVYSSGTTGWNLVDESVLDTADYYKGTNDGVQTWYIVHGFASSALTTTSRITSVRIQAEVNAALGHGDGYVLMRDPQTGEIYNVLQYNPGGTNPDVTVSVRPWDARPWTVDDMRHLQVGHGQPYGAGGNSLQIYQAWVTINYTNPPNVEQALTQLGAGGGGGGGNHNILSATHLDSSAATVVRGDIIRGNSTPAWSRLPISGSAPSNAVLVSDGTDAYWRWPSPVDRITASSSNVFWGQVDLRAGANTALSVSSNTITISSSGGGGGAAGSSLTVTEVDGSPSVASVSTIKFPNDSVTDNGSGTVTIRDVPQAFIGAKAYNSTTQSINTATDTALTLDSEDFDTDGFHSTSANTSRMTIPAGLGGKYLCILDTYAPFTGGGFKYLSINKNGNATALYREEGHDSATISVMMHLAVVLDLAAGDYIEMWFQHNQGSSQNVGHASARRVQTQFTILKLDSGKVGSGIGARVYNTADVALGTATETAITFNSERFDTDAFHSTSANTSRMTIPTGLGGKYLIEGHVRMTSTPGSPSYIAVLLNGATKIAAVEVVNDTVPMASISTIYDLAAGDYVELLGYATTASKSAVVQANYSPEFSIMRLDSGTSAYTGPLWGSGTAFPSGPATNDRFTRTDLGLDYYYDGTNWISINVPGWLSWFVGKTDSTNFYWDGNDLAGFTEQTVTGTTTWVESGNLILASATNQTADDASVQLIAKTISTGDSWMLAVNSMLLGSDVANSTAAHRDIGIVMTDGTTTTSNCIIGSVQIDNGGGGGTMVLVGRHGTLTNVNTGAPWVSQTQVAYGNWIFIKLKYSAANTFQVSMGPSPYQLSAFGEADISKTMTPTHIGLYISEMNAGTALGQFGPLKKV